MYEIKRTHGSIDLKKEILRIVVNPIGIHISLIKHGYKPHNIHEHTKSFGLDPKLGVILQGYNKLQ